MKVEEISDFLSRYVVEILKESRVDELFPPQAEAIPYIRKRENLILAIPTASGKTLVAEIAMISEILRGGKCLYITPLRALATEKFEEFKKWEKIGVSVGISTGDYDSSDPQLAECDILVTTSEKADSLLRNNARWIKDISCLVVDEIHLLDSEDRGHNLEIFLTKMRKIKDLWIIGLSATAPNVAEIAEWLNAKHLCSNWRPTPLYYGTLCDGFSEIEKDGIVKRKVSFEDLVEETVSAGGGVLIFESTRKNAENLAERLSKIAGRYCRTDLSDAILEENDGEMSRKLADCVKKGCAFHHAGLLSGQRRIIEYAFREGEIKVVVATPTLAAGVNLPARRVIIKSLYRFDGYSRKIKVSEFKQMAGRAGRPRMDEYGEAIVVVSKKDKDIVWKKYIHGEPENIVSKLGVETKLRFHCLSLVCDRFAITFSELLDFFSKTLFFKQSGISLDYEIERVLRQLENWEMVEIGEKIVPRNFGKLVSKLYIDPLTGFIFYDTLKKFDELSDLAILHLICRTPDMEKLSVRKNDEWVEEIAFERRKELTYYPAQASIDYDWFLEEIKTALCLYDWINEEDENRICEKFGIAPGDLRRLCETAEWLMHALSRIGSEFGKNVKNMELRIRYGVKGDLLELVTIRNIGRVRARKLFNAGIKTKEDILAKKERLPAILGEKIAEKVIKEVQSSIL